DAHRPPRPRPPPPPPAPPAAPPPPPPPPPPPFFIGAFTTLLGDSCHATVHPAGCNKSLASGNRM
ncbi:MAG: hypothetical protein V4803_33515, partial [Burkholderia gladioli]